MYMGPDEISMEFIENAAKKMRVGYCAGSGLSFATEMSILISTKSSLDLSW